MVEELRALVKCAVEIPGRADSEDGEVLVGGEDNDPIGIKLVIVEEEAFSVEGDVVEGVEDKVGEGGRVAGARVVGGAVPLGPLLQGRLRRKFGEGGAVEGSRQPTVEEVVGRHGGGGGGFVVGDDRGGVGVSGGGRVEMRRGGI